MLKAYKNIAIIIILVNGFVQYGCSSKDDESPIDPNPMVFSNQIDAVTTLGGTKNESAQAIKNTTDGGYVILGYTQSMDGDIFDKQNESFDYWLLKYDAQSELQWSKTYGGTGTDVGSDIVQTNDGGYAIIGYSTSSDEDVTENAGAHDYWIAKLYPAGNISWQRSFGYSGTDEGLSILQTNDNGYLITGVLDVSASGGAGNTRNANSRHAGGDYWAIKLNDSGIVQWSKYFGGSFTDVPYDVVQTDTGFILAGSSDSDDVDISASNGQYDFWVISISNSGALIWEKSFGGSEIDEARAIVASDDGNFMVVGDTRSNDVDISENLGGADLWVLKINPMGDMLWEKTIGGSSFDVGRSIKRLSDGGFLISGSSRSSDGDVNTNQGQNDAWVLKINSMGDLEWENAIGGTSIDFANDAIALNDGSIIAVGETTSNDGDIDLNQGFSDLLIIKLK